VQEQERGEVRDVRFHLTNAGSTVGVQLAIAGLFWRCETYLRGHDVCPPFWRKADVGLADGEWGVSGVELQVPSLRAGEVGGLARGDD
jgi:hypothetical protein